MTEPTVHQELLDRKTQREKLMRFFLDEPHTIWQQETLAEKCGSDVGAIRTRISELRKEPWWNARLRRHSNSYEAGGKIHRGKMRWQFVPRPAEPLGPDAAEPRSGQLPLIETRPRG